MADDEHLPGQACHQLAVALGRTPSMAEVDMHAFHLSVIGLTPEEIGLRVGFNGAFAVHRGRVLMGMISGESRG